MVHRNLGGFRHGKYIPSVLGGNRLTNRDLRLVRRLFPRHATQQIVRRERRERVSHHNWSGDA